MAYCLAVNRRLANLTGQQLSASRYSAPDSGAEYCYERVCVFVCPRSYLRNYKSDLHQFLCMLPMAVARPPLAACCELPVLLDDVIFAHKTRLLDVAAQLKRSAHEALDLAINCAQ